MSQLAFFKAFAPALLATLGDQHLTMRATSQAWIRYRRQSNGAVK